ASCPCSPCCWGPGSWGTPARGPRRWAWPGRCPHPVYSWKEGARADIALVRLERPVQFSERVLPICLPDSSVHLPCRHRLLDRRLGEHPRRSAPAPPADPAEAEGAHHRLRRLQPPVLAGSRAGRHHGGHAVCRLPGGGEGRLPGEHPLCPRPGSSEPACPREGSSRLSSQGISAVLSTPLRWPRLDKPSPCSPTHLSESAHTGAPRCLPGQPGRRGPRGVPGGFKSGRRNGLPGRGPSAHCLPALGP
uniref:Peptidase S1 domain-containing protein n=1 Tax=Oryctolagus cuniculus TaxID=9986 RepID=A0A5F9DG53_RABIT